MYRSSTKCQLFLMNSSPQIFITIYTSIVWKTFFEEILVLVIHNAKNYPLLIIWMIQKARDSMFSLFQLGCSLQSYFKVNIPQFRCRVGFCILNNLYTKYTFHSPHFQKIQKQSSSVSLDIRIWLSSISKIRFPILEDFEKFLCV